MIYADLSSRPLIRGNLNASAPQAGHGHAALDGLVVYPGVWESTVSDFELSEGSTVIFDALNVSDSHFIMVDSGTPPTTVDPGLLTGDHDHVLARCVASIAGSLHAGIGSTMQLRNNAKVSIYTPKYRCFSSSADGAQRRPFAP